MGFFGKAFRDVESVALIDIGSASVGGALLYRDPAPALEYSVRLPIEPHEGEETTLAMLQTLEQVVIELVKTGAPHLRTKAGSGSVRSILVSITSPWQETIVRTERIQENDPFVFSRNLLKSVVEKSATTKPDHIGSGEAVIATMLNGYQTNEPFGKKIRQADITILSSSINSPVAESIETVVRKGFHTKNISFSAFPPLAYAVFRDVFPHENNYLVIDASGDTTDIAFIQQGLLSAVLTVDTGVRDLLHPASKTVTSTSQGVHVTRNSSAVTLDEASKTAWVAKVAAALKTFSGSHALPQTIFLLSDDTVREEVKTALDDASLRSLWLTSDPLTIIPVLPNQLSSYVKVEGGANGDSFLMLLALYRGKRIDRFDA